MRWDKVSDFVKSRDGGVLSLVSGKEMVPEEVH